jgi:hypothetical protein
LFHRNENATYFTKQLSAKSKLKHRNRR